MNITLNPNAQAGVTGSSGLETLSGVSKTSNAAQTSETNSDPAVTKSANFDRVDLSDSAMQYLEEETASDSESGIASSEVNTSAEITESADSEVVSQNSDDVLASELYRYTKTELQEFMLDGTITRSEYEAELAKRSGESASVSE